MAKLRSSNTRPLVALDISSSAVKLLQLGGSYQAPRVEALAVVPLQPGTIQDKQIRNPDNVSEAIRQVLEKAKLRASNISVATALPAGAAFTKVFPIPAGLSELEMEEQISHEASNHIPFAIDEVRLDFQPLGPAAIDDMTDVLLVAVRDDQIQNRLDPLAAENIHVEILDVENLAIQNAVQYWMQKHPAAANEGSLGLIEIGSEVLTLTIFHEGKNIYSREQSSGMHELVREIMSRFGVNFTEADRMLRSGELPASYREEVLPTTRDALVQQINRLLQFFYASVASHPIENLLLAGGGARLEGLAPAVLETLGINAQVFDPFAGLTRAGNVSQADLAANGPAFMSTFGLALRHFLPDHR